MNTKTSLIRGSALGALAALALGAGAQAQETTTVWKGAPQWSNDGVTFKVRGRLLIDAVFQSVDREVGSDFDTRALRGRQVFLGVEGQLNQFFFYKAEGGAVNGGAWGWDDVTIEWKPDDFTSVSFGNIKVAGLENLTSTRFTTFMDRGPYGEIGPDSYLVSAVAKKNGANWVASVGVQGDTINNADLNAGVTNAPDSKERIGVTGRLAFAPVVTDNDKLHLGVWARYRDHGNEAAFAYATRPITAFGNRYITTGAIGDTDKSWGVESAFVHNNFSIQAEYADVKVARFVSATTAGSDPDVKVGYAMVSFWPTGEMRNYDAAKGEFGRPKILNPVTAGGMGGVELALRYDYADLSDAYDTASGAASQTTSRDAGVFKGWTAGINYYPTPYVRFQANYSKITQDMPVIGRDVDVDQLQFRAQLDF